MSNPLLNWNIVRDDLVLGSCPRELADLDRLCAETGISAMLSVQHDECLREQGIDYRQLIQHGHALGLRMERCPMRDFDPTDQERGLAAAVRMLYQLLYAGHRVYVHCTAGINRSSLVMLAYLAWIEGMDEKEALAVLMRARPRVYPTWEAFRGCRDGLIARCTQRIRQRAVELSQTQPVPDEPQLWLQAEREILREILTAG